MCKFSFLLLVLHHVISSLSVHVTYLPTSFGIASLFQGPDRHNNSGKNVYEQNGRHQSKTKLDLFA